MVKLKDFIWKVTHHPLSFHFLSIFLILISLLFSILSYDISRMRFLSSLCNLRDSCAYWWDVRVSGQAEYGSSFSNISSVNFFDTLSFYLPFDIDTLFFKFEHLFEAAFLPRTIFIYSFNYLIFIVKLVFWIVLLVLGIHMINALFEMLYFDFSKNPQNDSLPLRIYKKIAEPIFSKLIRYFWRFIKFFFHSRYFFYFCLIWIFNFNGFSIFVEFVCWIFSFPLSPSSDALVFSLSTFVLDLLIMFLSAPLIVWLIIGFFIFYNIRKENAHDRLDRMYRMCIGYLKSLGINVMFEGRTGAGKTTLLTQSGILLEDSFHTDQYDSIYDCFTEFPDFPWDEFEHSIDFEREKGLINSLHSARNFVTMKLSEYIKNPVNRNIWGYEGKLFHNTGYRYISIWETLYDYSQLYYMYGSNTSSILSNYSVRSDLFLNPGYFVDWNNYLTRRTSDDYEYSRYSHIMDQDSFRFDKPFDYTNPNVNAIEYCIALWMEMDKDRGNQYSNLEYDRNSEESNPLNDGLSNFLMYERHFSTVRFKCYLRILADLQRSGNFNAKENHLFDKLYVEDKSENRYTLKCFFEKWIYDKIHPWHKKLTKNFKIYGQTRTLLVYILRKILVPFFNYTEKQMKLFGYNVVKVAKENACNREAPAALEKTYLIHVIAYNDRFVTDAFNAMIDESSKLTPLGLVDQPTYEGVRTQFYEFEKHNSNFARKQFTRIERIKNAKKKRK